MATPLTDSINALTTYANGVTGASDTTLSDAVHSLANGYGGGGEGGGGASKKDVNFYDYDGTLLHSYTAQEALALTALPENPSHTGLTAQGWNWSLADMKSQVQSTGKCDIGQMYITDDGKTRIYVHFEEGRSSPYLGIGVNGTVEVDWGDGSSTSTLTGNSSTTVKTEQHIYNPGDYVIKIRVVSGSFTFFGASNASHILKKSPEAAASNSRVYTKAVQKIELGSGITGFGDYAFSGCYSLESITIPSSVTSIGNYMFQYCYNLESITIPSGAKTIGSGMFQYCSALAYITIPSGVTTIGNYMFQYCSALAYITIPSGVTTIGNYMFQYCYNLAYITIPSGAKNMGSGMFQSCYSLASITIPSSVTSIGTYAFGSCTGVGEYHLLSTKPPYVMNKSAFDKIPSDCVIYVPQGCLEAYQAATNWSTYASHMQEEAA